VLSAYLIGLNDAMPDDRRQELMRFVTRLSGSSDTREVERQRAELIALRTVQRVLPVMLNALGLHEHAKACESAIDIKAAARAAARAAEAEAGAAWAARAAARAAEAEAGAAWAARAAARAAKAAARAAEAAAGAAWVAWAAAKNVNIWLIVIEITEEAFAIGNQATALDTALIVERMDKIRQLETT
jgi:hypothetical protein